MRRWSPGRIVVAIIFLLLALNAWLQVAFVPLGRSDDPTALTLLQALVGATAMLAAVGSWSGARWAPVAALSYGVVTGAMIVLLGPLLDLEPGARNGLWFGALVVLVVGAGLAWYLRRSLRASSAQTH